MTSSAEIRVVFRLAAGPRRGFGHLTRCLALARALGVRPLVALRGPREAREAALALGADVLARPTRGALAALRPDVVVIDDPVTRDAAAWAAAARRAGALVVTIHDLGIGYRGGDLVIDGSVAQAQAPMGLGRQLTGARFAVLDPAIAAEGRRQGRRHERRPARRVLIALGGGPHARRAHAIAQAIAASVPDAEIRIAGGFSGEGRADAGGFGTEGRVRWIGSPRGLARELAAATVAVVGGGVSLYEACALGTPAVSVPVVRSQVPTVVAFARRKAALGVPFPAPAETAARAVVRLLDDESRRRALTRRSRQLVDGFGAARAAEAVAKLAAGGRR